jgi:hypothetical protein
LLKTRDLALNLTLESLQSVNKDKDYTSSISLIGVSNADWGGDLDSRKSTVGNIFVLENSNNTSNTTVAISWLSKLQKVVVLSSAEAEYIALKEATKESLYLQNFIKELFNYSSIKQFNTFNKVNTIKTDSLSAIELAKNPIYYARTKYVDITYYFVRENLLSGNIDLVYKNTSTILADNLTKSTAVPIFLDFKSRISLVQIKS